VVEKNNKFDSERHLMKDLDNKFLINTKNYIEKELGFCKELTDGAKCILLGFPTYINIGDLLIWMGEINFLKKYLNAKKILQANIYNGCINVLEKCIFNKDIIFLQGGGNWGDLWYEHQKYREDIITRFKDNKIIVFPQTIYYRNKEKLIKSGEIINAHSNLTILVRDKVSEVLAKEYYYNADIVLCPDMAFYFDLPKVKSKKNKNKMLFLCRRDKENAQIYSIYFDKDIYDIVDWIDILPLITLVLSRLSSALGSFWGRMTKLKIHYTVAIILYKISSFFFILKAWILIYKAIKIVKMYRHIVSSRMHGHILATMLRIDNTLLPNAYYKNEEFYRCWTVDDPISNFDQCV